MKIESGRAVGGGVGAKRAGGAAAPGFSVGAEATQRVAAAAPAGAVAGVDALMALQGEADPMQRRARQARRGRAALDALDELVKGLVLGTLPESVRTQLQRLRRDAETTGEPELDSLLREIDTRVEVELAKLEMVARVA
ncbi:MAG: flagellar assembly protein FliX [Hyphomonadaceae bacterium]|nr:flagellar assembly protein FliX [Hyphomonadaceae bacterium]